MPMFKVYFDQTDSFTIYVTAHTEADAIKFVEGGAWHLPETEVRADYPHIGFYEKRESYEGYSILGTKRTVTRAVEEDGND